jgi:hypothetical protein
MNLAPRAGAVMLSLAILMVMLTASPVATTNQLMESRLPPPTPL